MGKKLFIGLAVLLITVLLMSACKSDNQQQENSDLDNKEIPVLDPWENVNIVFPSVMEEFTLEDFTEEFFKSNTLILVPYRFANTFPLFRFYTVFTENGKLNFLMEIPDLNTFHERSLDYRIFAVVLPNQVFSKYEIGESIVFFGSEHLDLEVFNGKGYYTENCCGWLKEVENKNCREWLKEVEKNAVQHRVGYATNSIPPWYEGSINLWPIDNPPIKYFFNITVIQSVESLQEHFYVSATE